MDVALALARADRELPRRRTASARYDLTARTSADLGDRSTTRRRAARSPPPGRRSTRSPWTTRRTSSSFQTHVQRPVPVHDGRRPRRHPVAPASRRRCRRKITFAGGTIGGSTGTSLGTLNHENMHQWFGDNVSEAAFNLTFWKEGFATLGEYLCTARDAATAAGGLGTPAGDAAFEHSLINRFNTQLRDGELAASGRPPRRTRPSATCSRPSNTYTRPGTAYLALLAHPSAATAMIGAMKQIQADYGGGSITEPQLEDVFQQLAADQSAACNTRLDAVLHAVVRHAPTRPAARTRPTSRRSPGPASTAPASSAGRSRPRARAG